MTTSALSLEPQFKRDFAGYLKRGFSAFNAAMRLWPDNAPTAYHYSEVWPNDPYVLQCMAEIQDELDQSLAPPSKEKMAKELYDKSQFWAPDDQIKAKRLVADLLGYTNKDAPQVVVNNTQNRVMIVKDFGTDDEWENRATSQQSKLLIDARTV